jgi:hypothetical protein
MELVWPLASVDDKTFAAYSFHEREVAGRPCQRHRGNLSNRSVSLYVHFPRLATLISTQTLTSRRNRKLQDTEGGQVLTYCKSRSIVEESPCCTVLLLAIAHPCTDSQPHHEQDTFCLHVVFSSVALYIFISLSYVVFSLPYNVLRNVIDYIIVYRRKAQGN